MTRARGPPRPPAAAGIAEAMARAPIAWVPLGALEYHADHLPNGTDGITGQGLLVAAAERLGGVVLPWSYVTMGTLAAAVVVPLRPGDRRRALRQTLRRRRPTARGSRSSIPAMPRST